VPRSFGNQLLRANKDNIEQVDETLIYWNHTVLLHVFERANKENNPLYVGFA
jgi:hypothetical protein